jgi:hypothetical protein
MSDVLGAADDGWVPIDLEREPLDRPAFTEHDWGGDGSERDRPVRAHVLAALRPSSGPYPPPVADLLTLGDPRDPDVKARRDTLTFDQEHAEDLVRMARDRDLTLASSESDEVWGPLHALAILRELDSSGFVNELLPLLDLDDEWYFTEVPTLLGSVGAPALAPLLSYLADESRWSYGQSHACDALQKIAEQYPELREQVVEALSDVLRAAERQEEIVCTAAMSALVELKAVEALPLIRRAFELHKIDEMMRGSWGDVLAELGVEPEEGDPLVAESRRRFEEAHERMLPRELRERMFGDLDAFKERQRLQAEARRAQSQARTTARERERKQKNKRKMEAASRKANRKRRR